MGDTISLGTLIKSFRGGDKYLEKMKQKKLNNLIESVKEFSLNLLQSRNYEILKDYQISKDCIGYKCVQNNKKYAIYVYFFEKEKITQLDGDICVKLKKEPISKDCDEILILYLSATLKADGYKICGYTGIEKDTIDFWKLAKVNDKNILLYYHSQQAMELIHKLMFAFNNNNSDIYKNIFTLHNPSLECYNEKFILFNDVIFPRLQEMHKKYGNMKIGYVRFNDVIYSTVLYLENFGYCFFSMTDDNKQISRLNFKSLNDIKILEFIKTDEQCKYSLKTFPKAIKVVPFTPIQTERFAIKIYFDNGELKKYVLPIDSIDEVVSYDSHIFTNKIWSTAKIVDNHKSFFRNFADCGQSITFINGYYISVLECYENGQHYTEPKLCNELIYNDNKMKIRKLWDWKVNGIYEDEETGLLKVLLFGEAFNWNGTSTIAKFDGTRCSLNFYYINKFEEGYCRVGIYNKGINFINPNMKFINNKYYDYAEDFQEGLAPIKKGNTYLFLDKQGNEITIKAIEKETKYEEISNFNEGLAKVSTLKLGLFDLAYHSDYEDIAGTWGFVDKTCKEIIKPQYIYANDFQNGIAIVCKGKWTIDKKWDNEYNTGRYLTEEELWGAIDKNGKEVIPFIFDEIEQIDDENKIFKVFFNGAWGVIDNKGNWLAKPIFNYISYDYYNGLIIFDEFGDLNDHPLGIYDCKQQKVLFKPQFDDIYIIDDNNFCVQVYDKKLNKKIEKIIDRNGKERFYSEYKYISIYSEQYYKGKKCYPVEKEENEVYLKGLVDATTGEVIVECNSKWKEFDTETGRIIFEENGKKGVCDFNGNIIIPAKYYDIRYINEYNLYEVYIGNENNYKEGLIKDDGTIVLEVKYKNIQFCRNGYIICKEKEYCSMLKIEKL